MNITELRENQFEFEKRRKDLNLGFKEIDKIRKKFVTDYPIEKILILTLDEFVIGKKDPTTFCNRIENELNSWGNIHGSNARKFGLYFGTFGDDKERKYRIGKKTFGTDYNKALAEILLSIIELIKNKDDFKLLKSNPISPMFKGKILSIYYPDDFLNIFSATHLNYFINVLGLDNVSKSEIDKQALLIKYKNTDSVMKSWTIYEFGKFLYYSFKNPNDEVKNKDLPKELKGFKLKDFPPIESIKFDFVSLRTEEIEPFNGSRRKNERKIDYPLRSKNFKRIGDRGEQVVLRAERKFLEDNGRKDLSDLIEHISETDDSIGYDILSYNLDNSPKFIEVKSTLREVGVSNMFLTANELEVSENKDNYYFYIVYEVGSSRPKIWKVKGSDLINDTNIVKKPVLYKLYLKTK
jgi:hypothetical protein